MRKKLNTNRVELCGKKGRKGEDRHDLFLELSFLPK